MTCTQPECSPGSSTGGSERSNHASSLPRERSKTGSCLGSRRLICQTRSDSGDTKALGQHLPRIRAFFPSLVCCSQARLRTFPGNDILGTRGGEFFWIEIGRKTRRVEVALDGTNATWTLVKPLREWFLATDSTSMTPLRQFGATRGHFDQGAARARPRCVGDALQTSLGHEDPRSCRTASANPCRKSFR